MVSAMLKRGPVETMTSPPFIEVRVPKTPRWTIPGLARATAEPRTAQSVRRRWAGPGLMRNRHRTLNAPAEGLDQSQNSSRPGDGPRSDAIAPRSRPQTVPAQDGSRRGPEEDPKDPSTGPTRAPGCASGPSQRPNRPVGTHSGPALASLGLALVPRRQDLSAPGPRSPDNPALPEALTALATLLRVSADGGTGTRREHRAVSVRCCGEGASPARRGSAGRVHGEGAEGWGPTHTESMRATPARAVTLTSGAEEPRNRVSAPACAWRNPATSR
jgi:hypothetical protein